MPMLFRPVRLAVQSVLLVTTCLSVAASAQPRQTMAAVLPVPDNIPAARDVPYPGTVTLVVDATDTQRGIFTVRETIPVAQAGPLTLLYPKWLPGNHAPRGSIDDVAGLKISAGGQVLPWKRDPVEVYAVKVDVPQGATEVTVEFQYVSPVSNAQGRVVMTPEMLNLQWNLTAFYPAGYYARQIPVAATAILPAGWKYGVALEPVDPAATGTVAFKPVSFETLVDSPMFAGINFRQETLAPGVRLNIVADTPEELAATPDQIQKHRNLVTQATRLFGAQHYDHYDFLLAITDKMGGIGLEHHRSSENGVTPGYFTKWDEGAGRRNLLPHEYTHSWDGKYRRGADLYTAEYSQPMRNSLLWVYEGQTQYWGYVLQARSGIVSKEDTLAAYASIAATLDKRPGRSWRPLIDTTNDPILSARRPQPWVSWQRSEDYYNEGLLIWLDADMQIRELTKGKKSLDDFAKLFFGMNDRDWGVLTYQFADVAAALNKVVPYDWNTFLDTRVNQIAPRAPLGWLEKGGYRLVYAAEPTQWWKNNEKTAKNTDLTYSLGFTVGADGGLGQVIWDSPAFRAGLTNNAVITAVGGKAYSGDALKTAVKDAQTRKTPIQLLVKQGDRFSTVAIPYFDGPKYPRLEKVGKGTARLDTLLTAR
ncbi:putative metalloprotease with PDZ domain [Sphingomonas prati]|uniref:Putative metalloprotease with PDZ domain n=2 Tax=Sphingomonas prati TaxID=1843237 RepID=A0A7W9BQ57_9SPHN|nr:putative metalloprotease with PDZ domain [Sphingomonas prati]